MYLPCAELKVVLVMAVLAYWLFSDFTTQPITRRIPEICVWIDSHSLGCKRPYCCRHNCKTMHSLRQQSSIISKNDLRNELIIYVDRQIWIFFIAQQISFLWIFGILSVNVNEFNNKFKSVLKWSFLIIPFLSSRFWTKKLLL